MNRWPTLPVAPSTPTIASHRQSHPTFFFPTFRMEGLTNRTSSLEIRSCRRSDPPSLLRSRAQRSESGIWTFPLSGHREGVAREDFPAGRMTHRRQGLKPPKILMEIDCCID